MGKKKKDRQVLEALTMVFQFGINMIVPICLCMAIGLWIGNKTGITWITIPLFFIGALAGFTNVYKMARRLIHQENKETSLRFSRTGKSLPQWTADSQSAASKDNDYVKKNE